MNQAGIDYVNNQEKLRIEHNELIKKKLITNPIDHHQIEYNEGLLKYKLIKKPDIYSDEVMERLMRLGGESRGYALLGDEEHREMAVATLVEDQLKKSYL